MPKLSRALPLTAALLLGVAGPALAQGTEAQREACTPDAVRLCQETIPDVGATEACMRRHEAQLSPRCRAVFNDATGPATEPRRARRDNADFDREPRRSARVAPRPDAEDDDYGPRSYQYLTPEGDAADTGDRYDRRAEREYRRARPIEPDEDFDDPRDVGGRQPYDER